MDNASYKLSVVVPCHNVKNILKPLVTRLHACPVPQLEIVVVDDASTDGTRQLLENELSGLVHHVVYLTRKRGKTEAVAAGAKAATGDYVIVQNAVLEFDPADYPQLLAPLLAGEADAVFAHGEPLPAKADLTSRLVGLAVGLKLPGLGGSAKAFRRPVLQELDLKENRCGFSALAAARLAKGKHRLAHVAMPRHGSGNAPKDSTRESVRRAFRAAKYAR